MVIAIHNVYICGTDKQKSDVNLIKFMGKYGSKMCKSNGKFIFTILNHRQAMH